MIKNFAELQERVRSSEPLVVSVAQAADQEVLLSVKAAADQGFIKPVLTGDRERIEELCGRIGLKPLEILQAGTEEEAVERAVRAVHDGSAQVLMKGLVNTSVYMRGILNREWGLRTGRLLSMMAVYEAPGYHKLLFCSDSGINVAPNLEQKKDILKNLLYAVRNMGIQNPKVAVGAMGGVAGLKAVIISYGAVGLIATIALVFLLPDPEKEGKGQDGGDSGQETKLSMKEWAGVFKDPRTWFAGIAVFATYSTYQTLSYFTPYFTNVLGATVVGSGAIAIIRTYGIRIVGAPLGGYMGDRIHSVSSVIATVLACGAVITLIFMFMPAGVPSVLLTVMTLVIGFMVHIARGAMFAVPSEVKIPRRYAASTAGVVCAIGFCPDLFQAAMYGHWLDTCGNAGYTRIFIYIIAIMVVGVINGVATVVYKKKYVATGLVPVEGGTEAAQAQ